MDAYRVRLWLKGPRCPCRCGERVSWSDAKAATVEAFHTRKHISTARRPYWGMCEVEYRYIPETVEAFRDYLVERRHVLRPYSEMLRILCMGWGEEWMLALLSNGYATWLWRQARCCAWQTPSMVFDLVKHGWLDAANIVLSWPTTAEAFNKEYLNYLVRLPCTVYYKHHDEPLTSKQCNWILHHPAMVEKTRPLRAQKNWTFVLLWTGFMKSWVRKWRLSQVALPQPRMENVVAMIVHMRTMRPLTPGTRQYKDMLSWVAFLARESPIVFRKIQPHIKVKPMRKGEWLADLVETVASTGRVKLLTERLWMFQKMGYTKSIQKEKIWKWADEPAFANPRITRALLRMSYNVLASAQSKGENIKSLRHDLLKGRAIVSTIDDIAPWLANRMDVKTLLSMTKMHSCPAVSAVATAMRATARYQSIQRIRKFRAAVHLTLFVRRYVAREKIGSAHRGDCPVCWEPKIIQPLHGDIRHGMCHRCMRRMQRNNMLNHCPMCRVSLREEPKEWPEAHMEWYDEPVW